MKKIKGVDVERLGKDMQNLKSVVYGDVATIRKQLGLKGNEALTAKKFKSAFNCSSFGAGLARCKPKKQ